MILGSFHCQPHAGQPGDRIQPEPWDLDGAYFKRISVPLGTLWTCPGDERTLERSSLTLHAGVGGQLTDGYPSEMDHAETLRKGSHNRISWRDNPPGVVVDGDSLGFRCLYYWISENRTTLLIASRLSLLKRLDPSLGPNPEAFVEQMLLSSTTDDKALLKGVYRLGPGQRLVVDETSVRREQLANHLGWGKKYRDLSVGRAARLVTETASEVVSELEDHPHPPTVSLSGGLDSRFLSLIASRRCGLCPSAINLGTWHWVDSRLASEFTKASGIPLKRVVPPLHPSMTGYVEALRTLEHLSDYMSPFWIAEYGEQVRGAQGVVINGFLGGPLTGMATAVRDKSKWKTIVKQWYSEVRACNIPRRLLRSVCRFDVDGVAANLIDRLIGLEPPTEEPFQQAQFLEFRVRQTGFVSTATYNLFRNWCSVVVPFADRRLVDVFLNLGSVHIQDQAVYRKALITLDNTGVPLASTSARLLDPETYVHGPRSTVVRGFSQLAVGFKEYIEVHSSTLADFWNVGSLLKLIDTALLGTPEMVKSVLIALNAAILWREYQSGHGGGP